MGSTRSAKHYRVTLLNQATTTEVKATTSVTGSAVDLTNYNRGVFITKVTANASGSPSVMLQARVDTTTWVNYATLHPDMTTTANNQIVAVDDLANDVRVVVGNTSTTSAMRLTVKAEVYV